MYMYMNHSLKTLLSYMFACHSPNGQEVINKVQSTHVPCKIESFLLNERSPLYQEQLQAWVAQHPGNTNQAVNEFSWLKGTSDHILPPLNRIHHSQPL